MKTHAISRMHAGRQARRMLSLVGLFACLGLTACGLPRSGPWVEEMSSADVAATVQLVEVTPAIAAQTRVASKSSFPEALLQRAPIDPSKLVTGDGVDVTVWESDGLGMFPVGPSGSAPLGEAVVDATGYLSLPHIGRVLAAGETLTSLRAALLERLQSLVIGGDVALRLTDRKGKFVVIQGDVAKPGTYPIEQSTRRLSGLLSMAAPNVELPEQMSVTLVRDGRGNSVRLADLYRDPSQDIALCPEDKVILATVKEHVVVLGAAGLQGRIALSRRNFSVVDALGEARGMNDATANPKGVYVLRQASTDESASVAILYHFDLTRPDQLGGASLFRVADSDLLYISDAPFTKVQKVMSVFGGVVTGAGNAAVR